MVCRLKTGVATPEALRDVPFEGVLVPLRSTGDIEVPTLDSIDNVGIGRLAAVWQGAGRHQLCTYYHLGDFKMDPVLRARGEEAEGLMLRRLDDAWVNGTEVSETDFAELEELGMIRSEFMTLLRYAAWRFCRRSGGGDA